MNGTPKLLKLHMVHCVGLPRTCKPAHSATNIHVPGISNNDIDCPSVRVTIPTTVFTYCNFFSRYVNFVQYLLLQLISPLFLLFVVSSLPHLHLFQTKADIGDIFSKIFKSAQGSVLSAVIDSHMYGNWLHTLITGAVFPNWLMFWALLWTNHELY